MENSLKQQMFNDKLSCEQGTESALGGILSSTYSGALYDSIKTHDSTGRHHYGGPNQRP